MKTLAIILTLIVLSVKVLSFAFDTASNEVRQDAQFRLELIEQVSK